MAAATTPVAVVAAVAMVYQATDVAFSGQTRSFGEARTSRTPSAGPSSAGSPTSGSASTDSPRPGSPTIGAVDFSSPTTAPAPTGPTPTAPTPTEPTPTEPPSTQSVTLTDDDNGASRFSASNMVPGDSETRCIEVTARARASSTVRGYAANPVFSRARLEDHILITVEDGDGGSFESCAGFVPDKTLVSSVPLSTVALMDSYDDGMDGWKVSSGTSVRVYRLTWEFDTSGLTQEQVNKLQGTRTGIDLLWEMRSS